MKRTAHSASADNAGTVLEPPPACAATASDGGGGLARPSRQAAGAGRPRESWLRRLFRTPDELGFLPHAWLAFLGFFVVPMVFMPKDSLSFWLCLAGLVVFLPCYYATFRREGRAMFVPISVIVALGTVLAPFNTGASVFMHYASFQAGQATTARNAILIVTGICGLMLLDTWLFDLPQYYYGPGLLVAVGMVGISINERQRHLANSALRRSQEEVTHLAQLAERERIARDLHDVIGHTLSTMTLKAELASKLVDTDPQRSAVEMRDIARTARETLSSVRETVSGYRRIGLAEQLDDTRDALASAGIALDTHIEELELMPRHESMLALLLREAVTNVIRHSGAQRCSVTLRRDAKGLSLIVEDDGVGFSGDEGQGLMGMRERLAMLDGQLSFERGGGTRLIARVPDGGPE